VDEQWLRQAKDRDERERTFAECFQGYRDRLRAMVQVRLDPRLQRRIDPSDVIQEAYLEASKRLDEYIRSPPMPLYFWLRRIAAQKLCDTHRRHLNVRARDVRREKSLRADGAPEASSLTLADFLVFRGASPSGEASLLEERANVERAIESLDPLDREIIVLRHVEELGNSEIAHLLGMKEGTACKRYVRALVKLKGILSGPQRQGISP
jgi:RNA polymerase sigma-70 factor (ECF subfamily)